jgi:hypothetical protein
MTAPIAELARRSWRDRSFAGIATAPVLPQKEQA